jgi:hypothetical protein
MKRLAAILGVFVIATSVFTSCGGGKGNSGSLTSEENDIVKAAIAIGCCDTYRGMSGVSMNNKEAIKKFSNDLSPIVAKYENLDWHLDITVQSEVSFSTDKKGELAVDYFAKIPNDGFFLCRFSNGNNETEVKFTAGKVGLNSGNVYIEEETKLLLNNSTYVYRNSRWVKDLENK